jgi:hypothetical protein
MEGFQKIVLITAIIILIIALIFIGISLSSQMSNQQWPPLVATCPDYWTMDGSGNNSKCRNVKNLGTCHAKTMDFNTSTFTGTNGACNKYNWANACKVSWDGITYGVNNPCTTN